MKSKTTATKGKWKTIKLPEQKGAPTFYSPRVTIEPKALRELAEELYTSPHAGKDSKNNTCDLCKENLDTFLSSLASAIKRDVIGKDEIEGNITILVQGKTKTYYRFLPVMYRNRLRYEQRKKIDEVCK